ncbi:MAG: choice-of-anchor X domain-containing protein [Candidatus Anstonellales archaeon]
MIWFDALIVALSLFYIIAVRFIRGRYSDQKRMREQSDKLRKLAEEIKKNEHNKKKLDEIYEEQKKIMGEMNKEIIRAMLITFAVLAIFLSFTWVLGLVDPYAKDDINAELVDDGMGCDKVAGDGNYSYCFTPQSQGTYKIFISGDKSDELKLVFAIDEPIPLHPRDSGAAVSPPEIAEPQEVVITAPYKASVRIDQATRAKWELPFAIPIFNIHTIYEPLWLFIFSSFLANIALSLVEAASRKVIAQKQEMQRNP